jgi:hypothetical protein
MTLTAPTHGLPGRFLLRLAHRLASPAACERIFVPLLADFQFEYRRATSPGARFRIRLVWILAFGHALGLTAADASAAHLRTNAWGTTEEERLVTRRLVARVALATTLCGLAVTLDMLKSPVGRQFLGGVAHWVFVLPAAFCMALPAGSLLGVVLTAQGQSSPARRWRPLVGVASLVGLATFALAAWVTPRANQAVRERAIEYLTAANPGTQVGPLSRGDREMAFGELRARAAELRGWGMRAAASRLDLEWHKKPALGASCLALALAGTAIARRLRRWAYRWPATLIVLMFWFSLLRLGEQAADAGTIAPALAMWGPCLAVAVLGSGAFGRRDPRRPSDVAPTRSGT